MASAVAGFVLGLYAGALIREEYYFPTSEKIQQAVEIFKRNEEAIVEAQKKGESEPVKSKGTD